jgi:hypothetical protein
MALTSFQFTAHMPLDRDFLAPLTALVAHALEYIGDAKADAKKAAQTFVAEIGGNIPATGASGSIVARLTKSAERLEIEIVASERVYRLVRQLPAA